MGNLEHTLQLRCPKYLCFISLFYSSPLFSLTFPVLLSSFFPPFFVFFSTENWKNHHNFSHSHLNSLSFALQCKSSLAFWSKFYLTKDHSAAEIICRHSQPHQTQQHASEELTFWVGLSKQTPLHALEPSVHVKPLQLAARFPCKESLAPLISFVTTISTSASNVKQHTSQIDLPARRFESHSWRQAVKIKYSDSTLAANRVPNHCLDPNPIVLVFVVVF